MSEENYSEKNEFGLSSSVVEVERDGKVFHVEVKLLKNSSNDEEIKNANSQGRLNLNIVSPGFGQLEMNKVSNLDRVATEKGNESTDNVQLGLSASIKELPGGNEENFNIDAEIILIAYKQKLLELGLEDVFENNQVNIHGYSEGAGIAVSLAELINTEQKDGKQQNSLTLYSLTSVVNFSNGLHKRETWSAFLMEVVNITKTQVAEKLAVINPDDEYLNPVSASDYLRVAAKLGKSVISRPREVLGQLVSAKNDVGMLSGVLGRALDRKSAFQLPDQLKKFTVRNNEACESLGANWTVNFELPRNDKMFYWSVVRSTINELKTKYVSRPVKTNVSTNNQNHNEQNKDDRIEQIETKLGLVA